MPTMSGAAEGVGIVAPVTKWMGETIHAELAVPRVFLCDRDGLRRPELAGTELAAVAGVRVWTGLTLRGTRE